MNKTKKLIFSSFALTSLVALPLTVMSCSSEQSNGANIIINNFMRELVLEEPEVVPAGRTISMLNGLAASSLIESLKIKSENDNDEDSNNDVEERAVSNLFTSLGLKHSFTNIPKGASAEVSIVRKADAAVNSKQKYELRFAVKAGSYSKSRNIEMSSFNNVTDATDNASVWAKLVDDTYIAEIEGKLENVFIKPLEAYSTLKYTSLPDTRTAESFNKSVIERIFGYSDDVKLSEYPTNLHGTKLEYDWTKGTRDTTVSASATHTLVIKITRGQGTLQSVTISVRTLQ